MANPKVISFMPKLPKEEVKKINVISVTEEPTKSGINSKMMIPMLQFADNKSPDFTPMVLKSVIDSDGSGLPESKEFFQT